jgi:hypothetical protein
MTAVVLAAPGPIFHDPNQQSVQSNATITASGSNVFTGYGAAEVSLFINVKAAPTGTLPTLQYTIQEVDPGDGATVIGTSVSSTVINAIGIQRITLLSSYGGSIKVSWTIGGSATPTFTQVYATLTAKVATTLLTDGVNGPAAVKAASTPAASTDQALVVALSPGSPTPGVADVTATGALGALNAAVSLTHPGLLTVGFQLAAGTLIGTIVPEVSFDGGTTWSSTYFDTPTTGKVSSIVFSSANAATSATIVGVGGSNITRVRVSAYTSGTANITVRATTRTDPSTLFDGPTNGAMPPSTALVGGSYNGTTLIAVAVDSQGRLITSPASSLAALAGFANGFAALTTNTKNFVGSTAYNEQTTGAQRSVSSTSAADTGAGTGAQKVTIVWFDSTGAGPNSETITLNGTTAVNTVSTTMCYIESITVSQVGSGASNAGTITLWTATAGGGTAIGTIAIGANQTFWCHHYVPTGDTCYITGLVAGANDNAGASFFCTSRSIGVTGAVEVQISDFVRNGGGGNASQPSFLRTYGTPLQVTGPSRINGYVTPDQATTSTYWLSFDFYQES